MKRNMIIKVITCIMMLVLIATTSVVPVMASPNTTTVNVHYVVADTSLKNFYTNPDNYFEQLRNEEETNQLVKCQNKWEQEFLYPNIKNGTIAIYEPEDYIKQKAKESKYNISQETIDKLIAKAKAYNYSFTTPYGEKFAYQERTYGGSQQYVDGYKDGEMWNIKDYFTIIGSLVDDYTDYNNNDYIKGKIQWGTNGYILNADKEEMTIYVLMTPSTAINATFIDNAIYNKDIYGNTDWSQIKTKEEVENIIKNQSQYCDNFDKYIQYRYCHNPHYNPSGHTFVDLRGYVDVFEDIEYPLLNYSNYKFFSATTKTDENIDVKYNANNNVINYMPLAFTTFYHYRYPTDSFYDVIYEYAASCIDADYYEDALIKELLDNAPTEEIREQIKNADYADIIDDLNECGYIGVDYNIDQLLKNTSVKVNILLGTDTERNYDMGSIVTAYGNDYQYPFKDYAKPDVDDYDNALTYLIHQQGHTVQDVLANHLDCCLSDEQISKSGFIKGVCTDIEENSSEAMSELGVYIELSGDEIPEFCEKLSDKNAYFVFDKDVNISLFNEWSGTCGYPDNYL